MSLHRDETFDGTDHTAEDMSFSDYTGASFVGTNLTYTDLTNTCMENATLTGADLSNAIMVNTNFRNADLTRANLTNVNLAACDLRGARLDFAILTGANVTGIDPAVFGVRFGTEPQTVAEGNFLAGLLAQRGIPGLDGEDGQDGEMGMPGAQGATGATGATGAIGLTGPPGMDGDYTESDGGIWVPPTPRIITKADLFDPRYENIWRSPLPIGTGANGMTNNMAYFVFMRRVDYPTTIKFVEFYVSTVGAGTQTCEVGLFSSPAAPNKASQVLTKLVADGTLDSITVGATVKRNTTAFNTTGYIVPAGTYLWAGCRFAMGTTQPVIRTLVYDNLQGWLLTTSSAGALTNAGPWTGALQSISASGTVPDLMVALV